MDPLTLATIVGLICNYRQEKGARAQLDYQQFMGWLESHRHDELKNLISQTHHLQSEVDALLRQDHAQLARQLGTIETMLAQILSRMDGFAGLARVVHPESTLSDQALEILRQFADSGTDLMLTLDFHEGTHFAFPPGSGGALQPWKPGEPRFFEDDMETLCQLGFIRPDHGQAEPAYRLTRAGAQYVAATRPGEQPG